MACFETNGISCASLISLDNTGRDLGVNVTSDLMMILITLLLKLINVQITYFVVLCHVIACL